MEIFGGSNPEPGLRIMIWSARSPLIAFTVSLFCHPADLLDMNPRGLLRIQFPAHCCKIPGFQLVLFEVRDPDVGLIGSDFFSRFNTTARDLLRSLGRNILS